jgi:hypothetical protein
MNQTNNEIYNTGIIIPLHWIDAFTFYSLFSASGLYLHIHNFAEKYAMNGN